MPIYRLGVSGVDLPALFFLNSRGSWKRVAALECEVDPLCLRPPESVSPENVADLYQSNPVAF